MVRKVSMRVSSDFIITVAVVFTFFAFLFTLPFFFSAGGNYQAPKARLLPFTVTVDPRAQTIIEDPAIEAMLSGSPLSATTLNIGEVFEDISGVMAQSSVYEILAAVGAPDFVRLEPGLRKEEVAEELGAALGWDGETQKEFLAAYAGTAGLSEGNLSPGLYALDAGVEIEEVAKLLEERFERQILSRYGTTTAEKVPLDQAFIIASMIQRETGDKEEMRLISGIIWNRIFNDMPLQLDATLQYAKANAKSGKIKDWWPVVYPRDKYIKSPYNTYQNDGLPPSPIANPSVSAVIAALNPKKTDCLFYFHNKKGEFYCSETYEEHVALLKKHFGRGK